MGLFDDTETPQTNDELTFPQDQEPNNKQTPKYERKASGRGICKECGEPAWDGRAVYCEEHRPDPQDKAPRASKGRQRGAAKLEQQLINTLMPVAMLWRYRDEVCGAVAVEQVPEIASALAQQAAANPKVYRALEQVTTTTGWLNVLAACAPIVMVAAMHHNPRMRAQVEAEEAMEATPDMTDGMAYADSGQWG